jgi:hypothetical protein
VGGKGLSRELLAVLASKGAAAAAAAAPEAGGWLTMGACLMKGIIMPNSAPSQWM